MVNIVVVSFSEFGHIVEIYNFSPDLKTQDLMQALSMFRYICFVFIISSLNYLLIVNSWWQDCSYSVVNETLQKRRQSVPLFPCLNCLDNDNDGLWFTDQWGWGNYRLYSVIEVTSKEKILFIAFGILMNEWHHKLAWNCHLSVRLLVKVVGNPSKY